LLILPINGRKANMKNSIIPQEELSKVFWPVKSVGVVGDSRRYEYY